MTKIEKRIDVINRGYSCSKELYDPNCEVSSLILSLFRAKQRKALTFEDLLTFSRKGWVIHYTGKKSGKLHLVDAIFDGEESEE
jgi:hypothetical protein